MRSSSDGVKSPPFRHPSSSSRFSLSNEGDIDSCEGLELIAGPYRAPGLILLYMRCEYTLTHFKFSKFRSMADDSVLDPNRWLRREVDGGRRLMYRAHAFIDLTDEPITVPEQPIIAEQPIIVEEEAESESDAHSSRRDGIVDEGGFDSGGDLSSVDANTVSDSESDSASPIPIPRSFQQSERTDSSSSAPVRQVRRPYSFQRRDGRNGPSSARIARSFSRYGPNGPRSLISRQRGLAPVQYPTAVWGGPVHRSHCAICLNNFILARTSVLTTPCMHLFCAHCIHRWLMISTDCPVCRHPLYN